MLSSVDSAHARLLLDVMINSIHTKYFVYDIVPAWVLPIHAHVYTCGMNVDVLTLLLVNPARVCKYIYILCILQFTSYIQANQSL